MAENVGKITVAIEAQTAELQAGLEQAERAVKQSSAKMEQSQKELGRKFKKSWTELSSKINIATIALNVAGGAVRGISGAMDVFAEKGTSGAAKVGGAIQAFGDAGIPIISQVIQVSEGIAEIFVRSAAKIKEVEEALLAFQNSVLKVQQSRQRQAHADALSLTVDNMATRIELMKRGMEDEVDMEMQVHIKRAQDRVNLETQLQKQLSALAGMEGDIGKQAEQMVEAKRVALELFDFETGLLKEMARERRKAEIEANTEAELAAGDRFWADKAREQERLQMIERRGAAEEQAILKKTADLQTQLDILTAQEAGDEEGAELIALESKFEKMREQVRATADEQSKLNEIEKTFLELKKKAIREGKEQYDQVKKREEAEKARVRRETIEAEKQLELIDKIEAKEKARLSKKGAVADDDDGGGRGATTSVSTAIGSFTVAMAGDPVQKEQATLLERIADSNAKIADMQEKEKGVKEGIPTKETKIAETTKEKETEIVEATKEKETESVAVVKKALTGMQKIMEDTQATIKDLTQQVLALGATEGQSDETKAKRAELREDIAQQFKYKEFLQREAQMESDRVEAVARIDPKQIEAETPQAVTVAMDKGEPIQKEQTSILKRIADSNSKMADAMTSQNNGTIIPAA